jgi:hypothetical protein
MPPPAFGLLLRHAIIEQAIDGPRTAHRPSAGSRAATVPETVCSGSAANLMPDRAPGQCARDRHVGVALLQLVSASMYCPRCGSTLEADRGRLICPVGGADF